MGVRHLWYLLAPSALRHTLPGPVLARRLVAVDASIWLCQFRSVHAKRAREARRSRRSRDRSSSLFDDDEFTLSLPAFVLRCFFRRTLRLLLWDIVPIFVFDGPTRFSSFRRLRSINLRTQSDAGALPTAHDPEEDDVDNDFTDVDVGALKSSVVRLRRKRRRDGDERVIKARLRDLARERLGLSKKKPKKRKKKLRPAQLQSRPGDVMTAVDIGSGSGLNATSGLSFAYPFRDSSDTDRIQRQVEQTELSVQMLEENDDDDEDDEASQDTDTDAQLSELSALAKRLVTTFHAQSSTSSVDPKSIWKSLLSPVSHSTKEQLLSFLIHTPIVDLAHLFGENENEEDQEQDGVQILLSPNDFCAQQLEHQGVRSRRLELRRALEKDLGIVRQRLVVAGSGGSEDSNDRGPVFAQQESRLRRDPRTVVGFRRRTQGTEEESDESDSDVVEIEPPLPPPPPPVPPSAIRQTFSLDSVPTFVDSFERGIDEEIEEEEDDDVETRALLADVGTLLSEIDEEEESEDDVIEVLEVSDGEESDGIVLPSVPPPPLPVNSMPLRPEVRQRQREERSRSHSALDQQSRQAIDRLNMALVVKNELMTGLTRLLSLLHVSYVTARGEADSMCAQMSARNEVDGVFSEDSDVLVYGADTVFKGAFYSRMEGHVHEYSLAAMKKVLGLDRRHLIQLALLLGSDYNDGVKNVGIVNALEIIQAFAKPGDLSLRPVASIIAPLQRFVAWIRSGELGDDSTPKQVDFSSRHVGSRLNFLPPNDFPNPAVAKAYLSSGIPLSPPENPRRPRNLPVRPPIVKEDLHAFAGRFMQWAPDSIDELLDPYLEKLQRDDTARNAQIQQQSSVDDFFRRQQSATAVADAVASIQSVRLRRAVDQMLGKKVELVKKKRRPSSQRSRKRNRRRRENRKRKRSEMEAANGSGAVDDDVNSEEPDPKRQRRN